MKLFIVLGYMVRIKPKIFAKFCLKAWICILCMCSFGNFYASVNTGANPDLDPYNFSIQRFTTTNGLHNNNIHDVLVDSYGFLWVAGWGGLHRYDGYTFTYYNPDTTSQRWRHAYRLFEDSRQNLLVEMEDGLMCYDRPMDEFTRYDFVSGGNDTIPYDVRAFAEDNKGTVWVWIHRHGIYKVDYGKRSFIPGGRINEWYKNNPDVHVQSMVFDTENHLWIGTANGLFRFDQGSGAVEDHFHDPGKAGSLNHSNVLVSRCDGDGTLWFGTPKGLNKFLSVDQEFETFLVEPHDPESERNRIDKIIFDRYGNLWTVSFIAKGPSYFNQATREFVDYSEEIDEWTNSIAIDQSGIVWIGVSFGGIYKFDPNGKRFNSFSIEREGQDVLDGKTILAVYKDPVGDIWIGGDLDGLYRYNSRTGKNDLYHLNISEADRHESNFILDIFKDSRGVFWLGTKSGLIKFDEGSGDFHHVRPGKSIFEGLGRTGKIFEDEEGKLWLATFNGNIVHYDPESQRTDLYSIPGMKVSFRSMTYDPGGFFWLGTLHHGLIKFDIGNKDFSVLDELAGISISSLILENNQFLWCATNGSGLVRYNIADGTKMFILEKDGLPINGFLGLEMDERGNLWCSSQEGLTRYHPTTKSMKTFIQEEGFLSDVFTYQAHFKSQDGEMIWGTLHGIVSFYPGQIRESEHTPPIVLTDLKVNNQTVRPGINSPLRKHITYCEEIQLKYDQNYFSISFASLDFSHPDQNKYSFYLQNLEKDWRPGTRERTAYYTNLDPGQYTFHVKGTNADGVWNQEGISIGITILPPWWKTAWAYSILGILIVLILYALRRYELNRQNLKYLWGLKQMEADKYKEIDSIKSKFFANISHEFRTPLTLILGPLNLVLSSTTSSRNRELLHGIRTNTLRVKQLIDQILDLSKIEARQMSLKPKKGDIIQKTKELVSMFTSAAESQELRIRFDAHEDSVMVLFDDDKFEKIMFNLLGNALKYTPSGGKIEVTVGRNEAGNLIITITDNGPGIAEKDMEHVFDRFYQSEDRSSVSGTGIGLALTREFVELHSWEIYVESEIGRGTSFTIELPAGVNQLAVRETIEKEVPVENETDLSILMPEDDLDSRGGPSGTAVLIVDDNPEIRKYIKNILDGKYRIMEAGDGQEGLEKAIASLPEMIISDVMMPGMDGIEFCSRIKKDERTNHIPVILLTAKASDESKIEGLRTGADAYLTKPFEKLELEVRIKSLVDQRRKLHEKFRQNIIVQPGEIVENSFNNKFLQRAINAVEHNLGDPEFGPSSLAREIGASRMLLHSKIKSLTDQTTSEFIRSLRLKRAAQLLQQRSGNISEVAYGVGFQNLSYFSKTFREQFGSTPSQYLNSVKDPLDQA